MTYRFGPAATGPVAPIRQSRRACLVAAPTGRGRPHGQNPPSRATTGLTLASVSSKRILCRHRPPAPTGPPGRPPPAAGRSPSGNSAAARNDGQSRGSQGNARPPRRPAGPARRAPRQLCRPSGNARCGVRDLSSWLIRRRRRFRRAHQCRGLAGSGPGPGTSAPQRRPNHRASPPCFGHSPRRRGPPPGPRAAGSCPRRPAHWTDCQEWLTVRPNPRVSAPRISPPRRSHPPDPPHDPPPRSPPCRSTPPLPPPATRARTCPA